MIKGLILDLAGVLYEGNDALPGAPDTLQRLRALGIPMRFVTNTSRRSSATLLAHLRSMGFTIEDHELYSALRAARRVLEQRGLRPLLLVHPDVVTEFDGVPREDPTAVLVGDAGDALDYAHLNRAFRLLVGGASLLAINRNRYFRESEGLSLDAGPFVTALEYAAGCTAEVVGKPEAGLFLAAVDSIGCRPEEALMIGDDVEADVNGALAAGLQATLVRTGKYRDDDERYMTEGGGVVDDLSAVARQLAASPSP